MKIQNTLIPFLTLGFAFSILASTCRAQAPAAGMLTLLGQQSISRVAEVTGERLEGPPVNVCWKLSRADVVYLYQNEAALSGMFQSGSGRDMTAQLKKLQSLSLADPSLGGIDRADRPIHVPLSFSFFSDRDGSHWAGVKIGGRQFVGEARRPRAQRRRARIVDRAANGQSIPLVQGIVDGIYESEKDRYISLIQGRIHQHTAEMGMGRDQVFLSADHPIGYGELVVQVDGKVVWREPNFTIWKWFEQAQAQDFSFIEKEVRKVIQSRGP